MRKEPEKGRSDVIWVRGVGTRGRGGGVSTMDRGRDPHTGLCLPIAGQAGRRQRADSVYGLSGARSGSTVALETTDRAGERREAGSGKASERGSRGACGLERAQPRGGERGAQRSRSPQPTRQDQLSLVRLLPRDGSGR